MACRYVVIACCYCLCGGCYCNCSPTYNGLLLLFVINHLFWFIIGDYLLMLVNNL